MCYDVFVMLINQYQFLAFVRDEQLLLVKYFATKESVYAFGLLQMRYVGESCPLIFELASAERKGTLAPCYRCLSFAIAHEIGFLNAFHRGRMLLRPVIGKQVGLCTAVECQHNGRAAKHSPPS